MQEMSKSCVFFVCVTDHEAVLYLFQLDENEDDDTIKRQRKGEGQITLDHGSDVPQVQGDVSAVYVLCVIANYDILNSITFPLIDLII
jgi:hypothetical protein